MTSKILSLMLAGLAMLSPQPAATWPSPLVGRAAEFGLDGGVVVFGTETGPPQVIRLGGDEHGEYAYWSLSKSITSAVTLRLAQDDPRLLDRQVAGATVRQLLRHTAGWDRTEAGDPISPDLDHCTHPPMLPRQFKPGARQAYSNLGYCILGDYLRLHEGRSYQRLANELVPETRAMRFDPKLGAAGGWSGTPLTYWEFARKPVSPLATQRPPSVPDGPYYGFGWRVDGDVLMHCGVIYGRSFALVVKRGDFTAVAMFRTAPGDAYAARDALSPLLLNLQNRSGGKVV